MLKQFNFFLFSSRLFHSIVFDGKNFQKRMSCLKKRIIRTFLLIHPKLLTGVNLKKYCGYSLL